MVDKEVVEFIRKNTARGMSSQRIHQSLLAQGKSDYDIREGFREVNSSGDDSSDKLDYSFRRESPFFESKEFRLGIGALILVVLGIIVYVVSSS